ncbi:MAG: class I mannose-6-phosphate isomerase [Planctomycetota bacterium]
MAVGPLKTVPIFKETVWGGDRLRAVCGKKLPDGMKVGESWELSVRGRDTNRIATGRHAGRRLDEIFAEAPEECFGERIDPSQRFPLLVKFLDARERLSIQVHPDDRQAMLFGSGDSGKWEAWVILEADEGARLYRGLREGTTRRDFQAALEAGHPQDCLWQVEATAGDVIDLPPGTPHAIGGGFVLAEIQQNSDLTYRVYDWGRVGLDGQPRELHLEQALEVLDFSASGTGLVRPDSSPESGFSRESLISSPFFGIERLRLTESTDWPEALGTFEVLMVIAGEGRLSQSHDEMALGLGDTVFLPADRDGLRLDVQRPMTLLRAFPVYQESNR